MPVPIRVYSSVLYGKCPLNVNQGRKWLEAYSSKNNIKKFIEEKNYKFDEKVIELKGICFKYEKNGKDVLKDVSLNVHKYIAFLVEMVQAKVRFYLLYVASENHTGERLS